MNKLLEVKNLKITFHSAHETVTAVRDVSFDLHEGEILGIVGESGCGKSATAKALVKLLPPHSCRIEGQVLLKGQNLVEYSERRMQKIRGKEIGMIFQDPMTSLNPTIKIGNQIIEAIKKHDPGLAHAEAKRAAVDMLNLVGIPQPEIRFNEYPHTLSGGMRQRAMIALALSAEPTILIADEPTTALDVTIQAQILDLMKNIKEKMHTSIVLITHDLSVIAGFCDKVLIMYAGRIVESGPVERLFYHPSHPYTQRLLQSIPRLDMPQDHPLVPIEGTPPNLSSPFPGCGFCARCSSAMHICSTQSPVLCEVGPGHQAACWRYDPRCPHG